MDDIINRIREKVKELGEDYDSLKPFMKAHLESVETLLREKETKRDDAIQNIKQIDFSLTTISEELSMSRSTLYNHEQLLKRYIEFSANKIANKDPYQTIRKLQEEKTVMQKEIDLLMTHDLAFELLKMENKRYKREMSDKRKEIERLSKQVEDLRRQLVHAQK